MSVPNMKAYILGLGQEQFLPRYCIFGGEKKVNDFITIPTYSVLVEHPDGLVLFDAGTNMTEPMANPTWNHTGRFVEKDNESLMVRIMQLGYEPADVKYVVVSHLHPDHDGWVHLFKNAKILVSDHDVTGFSRQAFLKQDMYFFKQMMFWKDYDIAWTPVTEHVTKLLDGITLYEFGPGHASGMLAMLLELPKEGNKLIVADAIYTSQHCDKAVEPAYCLSHEGYRETRDELLKIAKEHNAEMWFGHDLAQYNSMRKSPDAWYE